MVINNHTRNSALHELVDVHALAARISDQLGDAIIKGRLTPGTKLKEEELAETFKTSRTPVREALRDLSRDGLVTLIPRKGAWVTKLTAEEAADIYVCRAYLVGLAAKLAVSVATDAHIAEIDQMFEELSLAVETQDTSRYFETIVRLYDRIAEITGNQMLNRLITDLGKSTLRLRYASLSLPGRIQEALEANRKMVAAFHERDGRLAEMAVRKAISDAGQALLASHFGIDRLADRPSRFDLTVLVGE